VKVSRDATVADVKDAICKSSGIAKREQRLLKSSDIIRDDMRIGSVAKNDASELAISLIRIDPARARALEQISLANGNGMWGFCDDGVTNLDKAFSDDREIVAAALAVRDPLGPGICGAPEILKEFVGEDIKRDRDFLMQCMKLSKNGSGILDLAAPELKSDREFVEAAMQATLLPARALDFVSQDLYSDPSFALAAIRVDSEAFKKIPDRLQHDQDFLWDAIKANEYILNYLPVDLWYDRCFLTTLLSRTLFALEYVPDVLWTQREFVLEAVQIPGSARSALQRATLWSKDVKDDQEIWIAAARNDSAALKLASPKMRKAVQLQMRKVGA
jgi:hypothetical protein